MLCGRVILCIFMMLFTACATCAILFPQFRLKATVTTGGSTPSEVTKSIFFWYNETLIKVSGTTYITRHYSHALICDKLRTSYQVQAALSVAGAGLGGLACLFMGCWTSAGQKRCLGGLTTLLCFLAFACCCVSLTLSACSFKSTFCESSQTFEDAGLEQVEGFGLIAAAAGGFLIVTVVELVAVCCAC